MDEETDLSNLGIFSDNFNVLIVGDGDMSYGLSLARHLRKMNVSASLTTTTLDSHLELTNRYSRFESIHSKLIELGVNCHYGINATNLQDCLSNVFPAGIPFFDRIVFNFPHLCGKSRINLSRQLIQEFFQSATPLLTASRGEIWISLTPGQGGTPAETRKRLPWKNTWQVQDKAAQVGLMLKQVIRTDAALERLAGSKDGLGYFSKGFHNEDRAFRWDGSLSHVFALPLNCKVCRYPIVWSFGVSIMVHDPTYNVDQLHDVIRQVKPGLRFETMLLNKYVMPESGIATRTYMINFTAIRVTLSKPETHSIMLSIREKMDALELLERAKQNKTKQESA